VIAFDMIFPLKDAGHEAYSPVAFILSGSPAAIESFWTLVFEA